ncbi:MAG: type II secretion system protein [Phycisphaeraceae bacterium]
MHHPSPLNPNTAATDRTERETSLRRKPLGPSPRNLNTTINHLKRNTHAQAHRTGFSLIELLVVITIILILAATTVGTIITVMRANNVGNAVNAINAQANTARSIALRDATETALIFRFAPSESDRVTLHIAQRTNANASPGTTPIYEPIDDRAPTRLPEGVRIFSPLLFFGGLDWGTPYTDPSAIRSGSGQRGGGSPSNNAVVYAVRFTPSGQLIINDERIGYLDESTRPLWLGETIILLAVIDERELQAQGFALDDQNPNPISDPANYEGPSNETPRDFIERAYVLSDPDDPDFIEADIAIITYAPNTGLSSVQRNRETP